MSVVLVTTPTGRVNHYLSAKRRLYAVCGVFVGVKLAGKGWQPLAAMRYQRRTCHRCHDLGHLAEWTRDDA